MRQDAQFQFPVAREHGIVLVMALVFLLLLTLTGLAAVTSSSLEEKMTGNTQDRNIAFQSAESALVAAETYLAGLANPSTDISADPANGIYNSTTPPTNPIWDTVAWNNSGAPNKVAIYPCSPPSASCATTRLASGTPLAPGAEPRYIIEILGPTVAGPPAANFAFRVTARGTGSRNSTVVMLQSTFFHP